MLTLEGDDQAGSPLLHRVMRNGQRTEEGPALQEIREKVAVELQRVPPSLLSLEANPPAYEVQVAPALRALAEEVDRRTG